MVEVGSEAPRLSKTGSGRIWWVTPASISVVVILTAVTVYYFTPLTRAGFLFHWPRRYDAVVQQNHGGVPHANQMKLLQLGTAALKRTECEVRYDPAYVEIDYPMGDVPPEIGVCADVIVRSYRGIGVDLQELVHADMDADPTAYPRIWFNWDTDTNIDHRRVQNIAVFLLRQHAALAVDPEVAEYRPGDVVVWRMYNRRLHCGIVVDEYSPGAKYPNVVHNIGKGPQSENRLFTWPVMGHFRWTGE